MHNKFITAILIAVFFAVGCSAPETKIQDYPYYQTLENNQQLSEQFEKYMEWMSDKSPDAKLVFGFMQNPIKTIDMISTIFHEKVEFAEWLNLGHNFDDILTIEYYKKHYMDVYPIAHKKAIIEEINLLKFFTKTKGFTEIPEITFNLVSPLLEYHSVPVDKLHKRLKYNFEYNSALSSVTKTDLETAMKIYETGGYKYDPSIDHIKNAMTFIENNNPVSE